MIIKTMVLIVLLHSVSADNSLINKQSEISYETFIFIGDEQENYQDRNVVNSVLTMLVERLKLLLHKWEHVIVIRKIEQKKINHVEEIEI